jgi:hypothetical protein
MIDVAVGLGQELITDCTLGLKTCWYHVICAGLGVQSLAFGSAIVDIEYWEELAAAAIVEVSNKSSLIWKMLSFESVRISTHTCEITTEKLRF